MQSLHHAELRTARALEHLQVLDQQLAVFYASEPYKVERFDEPDQNRHIIRLQAKDPDDRLAILAGEVAHALRCALDNAVYSLAVFATNAIPDSTKLQWPVLKKANPNLFALQTAGVSTMAAAIIESLQPYQAGPGDAYKGHILWQLHALDIIDKHRRIPIDLHGFTINLPTAPKSLQIDHREIENGVEVSLPLGSGIYEMHAYLSPGVQFGDEKEGVQASVEQLRAMHNYITNDVFPRLAACFV